VLEIQTEILCINLIKLMKQRRQAYVVQKYGAGFWTRYFIIQIVAVLPNFRSNVEYW
jgi:hypothetical protein